MVMRFSDVLSDIVYNQYVKSKNRLTFPEFKLKVVKELNKQKIDFDEESIGYEIAEVLDEIEKD